MAIIDIITYNGEKDVFDIRYNVLKDFVDKFIVVEAKTTFSGQNKPLYFEEVKSKYPKAYYYINDENYTKEEEKIASSSPNTQGAKHWKREFMQKERISAALNGLEDEDICFICDCDEVWNPEVLKHNIDQIYRLKFLSYCYYLNNMSSETWDSSLVLKYKDIRGKVLNHVRGNKNNYKAIDNAGWHFTFMGGVDEVKRKLANSYTEDTYWNKDIQSKIDTRFAANTDFLGRSYRYWTDDSQLPKYVIENKDKYAHLFK